MSAQAGRRNPNNIKILQNKGSENLNATGYSVRAHQRGPWNFGRRAGANLRHLGRRWFDPGFAGCAKIGAMPTSLHQERLDIVVESLRSQGARRVLDLGCGSGPLLVALAGDDFFEQIVGLDISRTALAQCARALDQAGFPQGQRIQVLNDSFAETNPRFTGFNAAVLLETIEHIPPDRLSKVERAVFNGFRPDTVLITTPNQECNELLGVPAHRLRHPEHEFEWTRAKFESWAQGVAARNGYQVTFAGIGPAHPALGSPSQMALYTRAEV